MLQWLCKTGDSKRYALCLKFASRYETLFLIEFLLLSSPGLSTRPIATRYYLSTWIPARSYYWYPPRISGAWNRSSELETPPLPPRSSRTNKHTTPSLYRPITLACMILSKATISEIVKPSRVEPSFQIPIPLLNKVPRHPPPPRPLQTSPRKTPHNLSITPLFRLHGRQVEPEATGSLPFLRRLVLRTLRLRINRVHLFCRLRALRCKEQDFRQVQVEDQLRCNSSSNIRQPSTLLSLRSLHPCLPTTGKGKGRRILWKRRSRCRSLVTRSMVWFLTLVSLSSDLTNHDIVAQMKLDLPSTPPLACPFLFPNPPLHDPLLQPVCLLTPRLPPSPCLHPKFLRS